MLCRSGLCFLPLFRKTPVDRELLSSGWRRGNSPRGFWEHNSRVCRLLIAPPGVGIKQTQPDIAQIPQRKLRLDSISLSGLQNPAISKVPTESLTESRGLGFSLVCRWRRCLRGQAYAVCHKSSCQGSIYDPIENLVAATFCNGSWTSLREISPCADRRNCIVCALRSELRCRRSGIPGHCHVGSGCDWQ